MKWELHVSATFDTYQEACEARSDVEEAVGKNNGEIDETHVQPEQEDD